MTSPTRQEIIEAYDALDALEYSAFKGAENRTEEEISLYRKSLILAALPPKPRPTMAEVEWDDNEHYLAEATHPAHGPVLMLGQDIDDTIKLLELNGAASKTFWGNPEDLTPTGKRYTLTEVQE